MCRLPTVLALGLLVLVAAPRPTRAEFDPAAFVAQLNAGYLKDLEARDPVAAQDFRAAVAARRAGDERAAVARYQAVLDRVPDFAPALRRSCEYLQDLGEQARARRDCEQAVKLAPNISNEAALANVVATPTHGDWYRARDRDEAVALSNKILAQRGPDRFYGLLAVSGVADDFGYWKLLHRAVPPLARLAPQVPMVAYYVTLDDIHQGDRAAARREIGRTRAIGPGYFAQLHRDLWQYEPVTERLTDLQGLLFTYPHGPDFVWAVSGLFVLLGIARKRRKAREGQAAAGRTQ